MNYFNDQGNKRAPHGMGFFILRGLSLFVLTFIVGKLLTLMVYNLVFLGGKEGMFRDLPLWGVGIVCTLGLLFIYNSFAKFFTLYDREAKENALADGYRELNFFGEIAKILRNKSFIAEALTVCSLALTVSLIGGFSEIGDIFFEITNSYSGLISAAITVPLFFLILAGAHYDAIRSFIIYERTRTLYKIEDKTSMFLRFFAIIILYPTVFPLAPLVAFALITIGNILATISEVLSVLGLIGAICAIVLLIFAIKYTIALKKRKKLIKGLKKLSTLPGYTLSKIKNPYRSVFFPKHTCEFSLEYDNQHYDCLVLPTLNRGVPLVFTSQTDAYFRHRIGTQGHHTDIVHRIAFYPKTTAKSIVIVNPLPKQLLVEENNRTSKLLPGDRIWNITIHSSSTFLGAAERKCLDKFEGVYR